MNNVQDDRQSKRYRKKYKYMKIRIKSLILENAALCDEVAKIQESIAIVKDERKFLLRKVLEYERETEITQTFYRNDPAFALNGSRVKLKKRRSHEEGGKLMP
uniref:INO80 complex subunit E N-terminal domain-containing protein n=1 Tax=Pectinophora gossypiella TaxID=13191 RepID=A0A1E1WNH6_PECGO